MTLQDKISIVMQGITILGVIFAVYLYFRKPQEKSEVNDAVFEEKIVAVKKETDLKYDNLKELVLNLRDNHIHTLSTELRNHISESQNVAITGAERMGRIEAKLDVLITKKK